jgi:aminopeptidase N
MKTLVIVVFALLSLSTIAQEMDFNKRNGGQTRIADHETDPRVHNYDVGFYFLNLSMDNSDVDVSGWTRIDLNLEPDYEGELVFDFQSGMTIDSVHINDLLTVYEHANNLLIIDYTHVTAFNENYDVSVKVFYHGTPDDGMFNNANWYSTNVYYFTYSLTEPYLAKYWFPCKQVLSDKADSSYFYITVPNDLKAGSNGLLVNTVDVGGGKKRMEWQSSYPIAYYLISTAVGKYQDYSFDAEIPNYSTSVFVQNFIPDNSTYLSNNTWDINRTEEMLVMLSDKWGLFPHHLEKYGHCIVPLGGGMEHQTMTTLGDFDFRLVVHELAHSWFGDYVTCANWQDIWINEGFASYGEYLGEEFIQPDGYELGWLNECQGLAKEATTGSVYVPFEELSDVSRVFNYRLSYRKGACLVHMIRYLINDDDLFFATLREFLSQYGNSTATAEDLKVVLEAETGIDFDPFFTEWYYGEGFPTYSALWWQDGNNVHIELTQTTSAPATELFTIPMEFKIVYGDETFIISRQDVASNFVSFDIPVEGSVDDVIVNPSQAVLANVSSIQAVENYRMPSIAKIFPNPSDGNFTIYTAVDSNYQFELVDLNGKIVSKGNFSGVQFNADFSDIADGMYSLRILGNNKLSVERVVITR